jgi:hypothetical protein
MTSIDTDELQIMALTNERNRLYRCLADVMACLRSVGGDPREHAAFRAAFDELAKYGDDRHEAAARKWEERERMRMEVQP